MHLYFPICVCTFMCVCVWLPFSPQIEDFWRVFNNLQLPSQLTNANYHFFKARRFIAFLLPQTLLTKFPPFAGKHCSVMGRPIKLPCKFLFPKHDDIIDFCCDFFFSHHPPFSCPVHQGGKWVVTFTGRNSILDKVWEELVG